MGRLIVLCLVSALFGCGGAARPGPAATGGIDPLSPSRPKPRLIVMLTVDQLRADLPLRLRDRFGPAGFARFYREGLVYHQAFYAHATTETAVGHATLFTGALPRDHGIVGNEWFDLEKRAPVYAVDDGAATLLGAAGPGKSPHFLLVPTLGDVMIEASAGKALVRAVSQKDRAAILPAGRRGVAYWLDDGTGRFVTSSSYLDALPAWAGELTAERYRGIPLDVEPKSDSTKDFIRAFKHSPVSDQHVVDFVRSMLQHEPLGRDDVTDLLSISLSATDYIGHAFGPESPQAENNLLKLDHTLENLLALLEREIGKERVLFVLSADHGIAESPEWFTARGEDAGRVDTEGMVKRLNLLLRGRFSVDADLLLAFVNPSLWLDETAIAARGLSLPAVERGLAELVLTEAGVLSAYGREDVLAGKIGDSDIARRVSASVHPTRSGHVYLVPKPRWLLAAHPGQLTAMHGTPHPYDTHVPIYLLGSGIPAAEVQRPVDPRDIVATLARLLSTAPPGAASGQLLHEALGD